MKRFFIVLALVLGVLSISRAVVTSTRTQIDLRTGPIVNSGDVSNLALVLSVEFPTTGASYKSTYDPTKEYIGYWNANSCYAYNGTVADGYFQVASATVSATNFNCPVNGAGNATAFSGNFLNYAATSSIDVLRLALTGGDRYTDVAGTTVLQRAGLIGDNGGANNSFYANAGNFPTRSVAAAQARLVMPFGNIDVAVNSCEDRIIFGTSSLGGTCTAPTGRSTVTNTAGTSITSDLKARVKVCDAAEGPVRTDLCAQYPDGNYKPIGEIQRNADKVRVAVFGYLLNATAATFQGYDNWYGGVLRAPMKFTGPNQKDANGIVSSNPQSEWATATGVFTADPMNDPTFNLSGAINYLNRFGRNFNYKRHDPVGELYYESIRYFQGKQPTSNATTDPTNGTYTAPMLDNFPIYTTWTDPMQTACQRNYSMTMGDHQSAKDNYIPGVGSAGTPFPNASGEYRAIDGSGVGQLDAKYWTGIVAKFESGTDVTYTDSQGRTQHTTGNTNSTITGVVSANSNLDTSLQHGQAANGNNVGYWWAGVAYWANTQPIRADKPLARVRSFVIDVNEGGQSITSPSLSSGYSAASCTNCGTAHPIRQRALYLAGKYGGFADVGPDGSYATGDGNPFTTYVGGSTSTTSREWLAADGSTFPSGYFLASQPERLMAAIKTIFAAAAKPSGNLAGGSLSVSRLSKAQTAGAFYQAQLNSSDWSGTIIRTQITYNTVTQKLETSSTAVWDAGLILTGNPDATPTAVAPMPTAANRNIYSYTSTNRRGITFTVANWASLDSAVQDSLKTNPSTSVMGTDLVGQARLDYLRGDRSGETDADVGFGFRARHSVMGDSINSAPVLKGKPSSDILDADYRTFYSSNVNRTPTVYIGANDGMLHAFRAAESTTEPTNGRELFAYVPRAVSLKLNKLTHPAYVKEAYVDASLTVTEAKIWRNGAENWGTALVSGFGGGAKGLFALDVTDPENFNSGNVLWEFTDADDPDFGIGNLVAEPKIVKLAKNGNGNATPNYEWYAMVTSGYNNYTSGGANDRQYLYLLSLKKAPGVAWQEGVNFFKMRANNGTFATANTSAATGMGQPGVAYGISGNALYAYAGDLQGNLWKFDLTGASSTWGDTTKAKILFKAKDGSNNTQPITVVPAVTINPAGGYLISFGTGKFLEPSDGLTASAAQQSLYAVWDNGDGNTFERGNTGSSPTINGLISRTLSVTTGTVSISITGSAFSYGTSAASGSNQYRGWYADLSPSTTPKMERVAVDPVVDFGVMAVNSTIPGGDPCSNNGNSNQYRYDPGTGATFNTTGSQNTQGYLGSASLLSVEDGGWSTRTASGRYVVVRRVNSISPGVGGGVSSQETPTTTIAGRISWREITNFQ